MITNVIRENKTKKHREKGNKQSNKQTKKTNKNLKHSS